MALAIRRFTGNLIQADGTPVGNGSIRIAPAYDIAFPPDDRLMVAPVYAAITGGAFDVPLVCTDQGAVPGWQYQATLTLTDARGNTRRSTLRFGVPSGAEPLDIADITPQAAPATSPSGAPADRILFGGTP